MPKDRPLADSSVLRSPGLLALGAMFLVSGTVALIYEAAWQREFSLLFGSSAPATAAVLAAYFAGLGCGSLLLGKFAWRIRNPLAVYGLLELTIALSVLLVTPILSSYAGHYPALVSRFGGEGILFLIVRGLHALAAVALPTIAMGGTLPVLAQIFETRRERFGELAGWLYLLNTAGATCGVLVFPWLLGAIGMDLTVRSCAAVNAIIGVGALLLSRGKAASKVKSARTTIKPGAAILWLVLLAFLSGFVIFVLQVGWNRAFAQVHENSIHSFSFVVAIFIAAIAAGAQVARVLLRRGADPQKALGAAWIMGGFLTVIAPSLFLRLTDGLKYSSGGAFASNLILPGGVVVFLPVIFLATGLPLILHRAANVSKRASGDLAGMVLAANVAGSVTGALAGGFVFPGTLGLWRTIVFMGTITAATGSILSARKMGTRVTSAVACLFVGAFAAFFELPRTRVDIARGEKLLAVEEGTHGVVAVVERSGSRRLKLNNHYVLGGTSATGDERMQAHIPLILHGQPRKLAFLGYGTGITAGAAAYHPVEQSVALELVPEVAELAGQFFAETTRETGRAAPRVVINDARNFLRGTKEQFDVIVGDLVVPWRQGEGALYTLEQFTIGRERLAEGGIYCAWLPMFQLHRKEFELILRTFRTVFPNVSVWRGDFSPRERALALIGSIDDHLIPETVGRRLREMSPDRFNPQLKYERAFWMHFVGLLARTPTGTNEVKEPLNTENWPLVELRRGRLEPFVGRALQSWESDLTTTALARLEKKLSADALKGWAAGELMSEFTLLISENRRSEAATLHQKVSDSLGAETAQSIFGQ